MFCGIPAKLQRFTAETAVVRPNRCNWGHRTSTFAKVKRWMLQIPISTNGSPACDVYRPDANFVFCRLPDDAHAQRVCSDRFSDISASKNKTCAQIKQPVVAPSGLEVTRALSWSTIFSSNTAWERPCRIRIGTCGSRLGRVLRTVSSQKFSRPSLIRRPK